MFIYFICETGDFEKEIKSLLLNCNRRLTVDLNSYTGSYYGTFFEYDDEKDKSKCLVVEKERQNMWLASQGKKPHESQSPFKKLAQGGKCRVPKQAVSEKFTED